MVHCDLSIVLEMCGRDKHEYYEQNAAVHYHVRITRPIGSVEEVKQLRTTASRRLISLLRCQKSWAKLRQQRSRPTVHSLLETRVCAPE